MAELLQPDCRRCLYFFLYDGSKVRGEGDATREGICYFYPEETPLDRQELLCGQLAGVSRCVSELSFSPVQVLRLRRNKFAICMKDDFFWALGCSADVPTVSVCQLLDQLINLFCFYNGSVRQSYQLHSAEVLAARWARYLSYLQSGSSQLHHVFSCVRTIDSTNVDPLLLLKAALILQACQRCPLVSAGCILFRGRVVSTQMFPELTMKVMVHESETYTKTLRPGAPTTSSPFGGAVSSTTVFLTPAELQYLRSAPVDRDFTSHPAPRRDVPTKTRLSRTLSDMPSSESDRSDPGSFSPHLSDSSVFSPGPSQSAADPLSPTPEFSNGKQEANEEEEEEEEAEAEEEEEETEAEEAVLDESYYLSFTNGDGSALEERLNGEGGDAAGGTDQSNADNEEASRDGAPPPPPPPPPPLLPPHSDPDETPLIPMTLYLHRVKGLVLALLAEPHFLSDSAAMEEVYHSSLASLNGLEAHLRTVSPGVPGPPGPYMFAHFDCVQSTMTTNLSGGAGGAAERPFVRATSLLHSHFCNTETLQEAIIRNAAAAVYGTRSPAQETFFQQSGSLRNSGIPNHQDSAFTLPGKARHRLLKHGVNLL